MQIIGHRKCRNTQKSFRWFSERGISYHFLDLNQRKLSPRELQAIAFQNDWEELVNRNSKIWKERGLEWKIFDIQEEILDNPLLLITPIVRAGSKVVVGFNPEEWKKSFIDED